MVITLAEASKAAKDDIQAGVIDEFRKSSYLLDSMPFDDVVTPGTSGATLTYGYIRLATQRNAAFRDFNTEFVDEHVTTQEFTVRLRPLGGSFNIDRVLAEVGGLYDHIELQMQQLVKAARSKFHDAAINGDVAIDPLGFDGLDVALAGSSTELTPDAGVSGYADWTVINSQVEAFAAMELIDELVSLLDERPDAILGNRRAILRVQQIARYAGYLTEAEDAFGRKIRAYDGIPLIDLGDKPGSTSPIVPLHSRDPNQAVFTLTITGSPTGGDFTLGVTNATAGGSEQTTAPIAFNANAATVEAALEALSNVVPADVAVTGGALPATPVTITFVGTDDWDLTVDDAGLTGGTTPAAAVADSGTGDITNVTDLYAVRFGLDAFHGVSLAGQPLLQTWLPDFTTAGAVKRGEAEMVTGVALKATKSAAVLRNLKVA